MLLDSDVEWEASASIPQADPTETGFQYRYTVRGEDQLKDSPWLVADGDGELPVLPVLPVRVRPEHAQGWAPGSVVPSSDSATGTRIGTGQPAMSSSSPTPASTPVWLVPRADQLNDTYRYTPTTVEPDERQDPIEIPRGDGRRREPTAL